MCVVVVFLDFKLHIAHTKEKVVDGQAILLTLAYYLSVLLPSLSDIIFITRQGIFKTLPKS